MQDRHHTGFDQRTEFLGVEFQMCFLSEPVLRGFYPKAIELVKVEAVDGYELGRLTALDQVLAET